MENILDGLVKLDAYTVSKIVKLNLNQGFGVFISTPDISNELLRLNYKFVNTVVKLNDGKLITIILVPKSYTKDSYEDFSKNLLCICNAYSDDRSIVVKQSKELIDVESALNQFAANNGIKIESIYFNEPAHTINGTRILFNRGYIPIFGSHFYSNSSLA